jgi:hypothetical protein
MIVTPLPLIAFTVTASPMPDRTHDMAESLDVYRTCAFGVEFMREWIGQTLAMHGVVDATTWFLFVPAVYRRAVQEATQRASKLHVGKLLTAERVHLLVDDINREIWRTVEPVA